jgi:YHS domain-containing protein
VKELRLFVIVGTLMLTLLGITLAQTEQAELKSQTLCPVMGEKINKEIYVDHNGERYYFCCKGCVEKFKADPETYIKKMKEKGETPEKLALCDKCGEVKGSASCCKAGAEVCTKCGKHKGSPGCCATACAKTCKPGCPMAKAAAGGDTK